MADEIVENVTAFSLAAWPDLRANARLSLIEEPSEMAAPL